MFDCFELGLAERGTVVKMDGKTFGYLKKDLLAYAYEGKHRKFDPFIEKLQEHEKSLLNNPNFTDEAPYVVPADFKPEPDDEVTDAGNGYAENTTNKERQEKCLSPLIWHKAMLTQCRPRSLHSNPCTRT